MFDNKIGYTTIKPDESKSFTMVDVIRGRSYSFYKHPLNAIADSHSKYLYVVKLTGLSMKRGQLVQGQRLEIVKRVNLNEYRMLFITSILQFLKEVYLSMTGLSFNDYIQVETTLDAILYNNTRIESCDLLTKEWFKHNSVLVAIEDLLDGLSFALIDLNGLLLADEHHLSSLNLEIKQALV